MTVPFGEPIYHDPNLTIREVSIPAPSEFSNFIRGRQALACPRGCSPDRFAPSPACSGDFGTVGQFADFSGGDRATDSHFDRTPPREEAALAHHLVSATDQHR